MALETLLLLLLHPLGSYCCCLLPVVTRLRCCSDWQPVSHLLLAAQLRAPGSCRYVSLQHGTTRHSTARHSTSEYSVGKCSVALPAGKQESALTGHSLAGAVFTNYDAKCVNDGYEAAL